MRKILILVLFCFSTAQLAFAAGGFLAGWLYDATGNVDATLWTMSALVVILGAIWSSAARRVSAIPAA